MQLVIQGMLVFWEFSGRILVFLRESYCEIVPSIYFRNPSAIVSRLFSPFHRRNLYAKGICLPLIISACFFFRVNTHLFLFSIFRVFNNDESINITIYPQELSALGISLVYPLCLLTIMLLMAT
ncbi:hypothetical protein Ddye_006784 [Dipteronia dyeriana]|uniref:Uncharacterized protein n=1 Tax=Dipteronia dyeriana TaxID=168575 RepID=A0AAE0CR22_9ROSI|nr:hypothetical protein Ddye_006784 [Dipteronia dyeriana]